MRDMKQTLEISAMLLFICFILVGYQAINLNDKCHELESKLHTDSIIQASLRMQNDSMKGGYVLLPMKNGSFKWSERDTANE